jgi:hypothetical protein
MLYSVHVLLRIHVFAEMSESCPAVLPEFAPSLLSPVYTDKKESKNFLIYKEIRNGAVAKSNIANGLLIYD